MGATDCPSSTYFRVRILRGFRVQKIRFRKSSTVIKYSSNVWELLNVDEKTQILLLFMHKFSRLILSAAGILAAENARASVTLTFLGKKAELEDNS